MKPTIAYLAPEIPSLSATFVYHEILALRGKGLKIVPISVHLPEFPATEEEVRTITEETITLYSSGIATFLLAIIAVAVRHPLRVVSTAGMLLCDITHLGPFSRGAVALVYRFLAAAFLARILEQCGCRHLHAHFAHIPTDIAMYAARLADISFSFTSHANDLFERGWLLPEKVARAAKAITISEYNRRFLITLGADPNKIDIVRCGVDVRRFARTTVKPPLSAVRVIGSLGRLVQKKGFETLIHATRILDRLGLIFRLEIVGDGPLKDKLQALAQHEGVGDRIHFLGPMANDKVPAWLGSLDLFALACCIDSNGDMDGIPVALMEAMAAGVPVVSTTVSAIAELIDDEECGLLVPPSNPKALAQAIKFALENNNRLHFFVEKGKDKINDEFSEDVNIDKLLNIFESITKKTSK